MCGTVRGEAARVTAWNTMSTYTVDLMLLGFPLPPDAFTAGGVGGTAG